jgi:hypothetical protein
MRRSRSATYRSGFEDKVILDLQTRSVSFQYETLKLAYIVPERDAKYTPDIILPNGIIIELKGRFFTEDQQKMVLVMSQHPELDIRMVFMRLKDKIYPGSKTTYAMWCGKRGIKYAEKTIPQEWIDEPVKGVVDGS